MTTHNTGTREEWLKARVELLQAEKELTHRSDEVARQRQELPWVPVNKGYRFDTDEGAASLADLACTPPGFQLRLGRREVAPGIRSALGAKTLERSAQC